MAKKKKASSKKQKLMDQPTQESIVPGLLPEDCDCSKEKRSAVQVSNRNSSVSTPLVKNKPDPVNQKSMDINKTSSRNKIKIVPTTALRVSKRLAGALPEVDSINEKQSSINKNKIIPTAASRVSRRHAGALPKDGDDSKEKQPALIVSNIDSSVLSLSNNEKVEPDIQKDPCIRKASGRNKNKVAPSTALRVSKRRAGSLPEDYGILKEKQSADLVSRKQSSVLDFSVKEEPEIGNDSYIKETFSRKKIKTGPTTALRVSRRHAAALAEDGENSKEKQSADIISNNCSSILTRSRKGKTKPEIQNDSYIKEPSSRKNKKTGSTTALVVSKKRTGGLSQDIQDSKDEHSADIVSNRKSSVLTLSVKEKTKPEIQKDRRIKKTSSGNKNQIAPTTPRASKRTVGMKSNVHFANLNSTKERKKETKNKESMQKIEDVNERKALIKNSDTKIQDEACSDRFSNNSQQNLEDQEDRKITVKSITTPDWLPHGWIMESRTRQRGDQVSRAYKCYIDTFSGLKFYSQQKVFEYLETRMTDCSTSNQHLSASKRKKSSSIKSKLTPRPAQKSLVQGALPEDGDDSKEKQSTEEVLNKNSSVLTLSFKEEKTEPDKQEAMFSKKISSRNKRKNAPSSTPLRVSKRLAVMNPNEGLDSTKQSPITEDKESEQQPVNEQEGKDLVGISDTGIQSDAYADVFFKESKQQSDNLQERKTLIEDSDAGTQAEVSDDEFARDSKQQIQSDQEGMALIENSNVGIQGDASIDAVPTDTKKALEDGQEGMALIENSNAGTQAGASIDELPTDSEKPLEDEQGVDLIKKSDFKTQAEVADGFGKDFKQQSEDEQEKLGLIENFDAETQAVTSIDEFHKDFKQPHLGGEQEGKDMVKKSGEETQAFVSVGLHKESQQRFEDDMLIENSDVETHGGACVDEYGGESKLGLEDEQGVALAENSDDQTSPEETCDAETQLEISVDGFNGESVLQVENSDAQIKREFNIESKQGVKDEEERMVFIDAEIQTDASVTQAEASVNGFFRESGQQLEDEQEEKDLVRNVDDGIQSEFLTESKQPPEDEQEGNALIKDFNAHTQTEVFVHEFPAGSSKQQQLEESNSQVEDEQEVNVSIKDCDSHTQTEVGVDELGRNYMQQQLEDGKVAAFMGDSAVDETEGQFSPFDPQKVDILIKDCDSQTQTGVLGDEFHRNYMQQQLEEEKVAAFINETEEQFSPFEPLGEEQELIKDPDSHAQTEVFVHQFNSKQQQVEDDEQVNSLIGNSAVEETHVEVSSFEFHEESNQQEINTLIKDCDSHEFHTDSMQRQQQVEDDEQVNAFIGNSAVEESEVQFSPFEPLEESDQQLNDEQETNASIKDCNSKQQQFEEEALIENPAVEETEVEVSSLFEFHEESYQQVEDDQEGNTLIENFHSQTQSLTFVHELKTQQVEDEQVVNLTENLDSKNELDASVDVGVAVQDCQLSPYGGDVVVSSQTAHEGEKEVWK